VAFRPDGKLLVVGDSTGTMYLWRIREDELSGTPVLVQGRGDIDDLTFSPDNRTVAWLRITSAGGGPLLSVADLWDVTDPTIPVLRAALPLGSSHKFGNASIAFSPGGRLLATVHAGERVNLWETDPERIAPSLCRAVGDVITIEQWERYVPNTPYQPPCGATN
jgi:WD40 repeat protein